MAADVTITGGIGPAPQGYEVPNATEIIPKSVRATFDGTGAAGAFFPTVRIVSDGGVIVGEVATDTSVAAGASASVTFAPFLRAATASSGGSLTATVANYSATPLSIASNTNAALSVTTLTSGANLLDLTTPTAPTIITAGIYCFSFLARIVIALGGTPTNGSAHDSQINGTGPWTIDTTWVWKSAAGSSIPEWMNFSPPNHLAAGTAVSFHVGNRDAASARTYDSPSIGVVLLS